MSRGFMPCGRLIFCVREFLHRRTVTFCLLPHLVAIVCGIVGANPGLLWMNFGSGGRGITCRRCKRGRSGDHRSQICKSAMWCCWWMTNVDEVIGAVELSWRLMEAS